jgi:hypothetical protein
MRKLFLATAATIAVVSAGVLLSGRADAVTLTGPAATVRDAADSTNLAQDVRWVCRYGYYGRRHCWWAPGYYRSWRYRYY